MKTVAHHQPYGMGYPLGQLWSGALAVSPPNILCTPRLLTGGVVWGAAQQ